MLPLLRKAQPFLIALILAGAAYNGWFFYSRWHDSREAVEKLQAKEREDARRTIEMLGGGKLKILNFYANPGVIRRGEHANICYGVYGAKSVRLDPPQGELHPAIMHCLEVSPSKTTEYKLLADDGSGHTASEAFTLRVAP